MEETRLAAGSFIRKIEHGFSRVIPAFF